MSRLTQQQIESIPELYKAGLTYKEIANQLNVSYWTIQWHGKKMNIKVIQRWKYKRETLVTQKDQERIIYDYKTKNLSSSKLAKRYNVSPQFILNILIKNNIKRKPAKCYDKWLTKLNKLIRVQPEIINWKKEILKRDEYKCIQCWTTTELEIDHIIPMCQLIKENKINKQNFKENIKLFLDINNGRTLCKSCHKKTPTYAKQYTEYFGAYRHMQT